MIETTTWVALGGTLTLLGLVASAVVWKRRGATAGLRGAAWSLLPLAAGLTGVLRLGADIVDAVSSWAVRLVFSPTVWLGVMVAGVSGALFVVSGFLRRRGVGRTRERRPRRAAVETQGAKPAADLGLDDDIEAILKKHGIS